MFGKFNNSPQHFRVRVVRVMKNYISRSPCIVRRIREEQENEGSAISNSLPALHVWTTGRSPKEAASCTFDNSITPTTSF